MLTNKLLVFTKAKKKKKINACTKRLLGITHHSHKICVNLSVHKHARSHACMHARTHTHKIIKYTCPHPSPSHTHKHKRNQTPKFKTIAKQLSQSSFFVV